MSRRLRVLPRGLHAKLALAFLLMSCVPLSVLLMVAGWFVFPYSQELFPWLSSFFIDPRTDPTGTTWWLWTVMGLTLLVSILGCAYLGMKIVEPLVQVSEKAKRLVEDPTYRGHVEEQDGELGDVARALNTLAGRVDHLLVLSQNGSTPSSEGLNAAKRTALLSSLGELNELMRKGTMLDALLTQLVERLAAIEEHMFGFLCLQPTDSFQICAHHAAGIEASKLKALVFESSSVTIDAGHPPTTETSRHLQDVLEASNVLMQPILFRGRPIGVLAIGNHESRYTFPREWQEFLKIFAGHISVAMEWDQLARKTPRDMMDRRPQGSENR